MENGSKIEIYRKKTAYSNAIRIQSLFTHNIGIHNGPHATVLSIYYSVQYKKGFVHSQNVLVSCIVNCYSAQRYLVQSVRLSESAGCSSCTTWILYGYHFTIAGPFVLHTKEETNHMTPFENLSKNIRNQTLFQQRQKRLFPQFHLKSVSVTCSTSNFPVSLNLVIIFFKTSLDKGPFRKLFKYQYSCTLKKQD